jgi:hypothetical protein
MTNNNSQRASLDDFKAFHGMLCGKEAALRALQTFEGGAITFASQDAYDAANSGKTDIVDLDFDLTIVNYYFLVAVSFTGFSTLLGSTKLLEAIEYVDNDDGDGDAPPNTPPLRFKRGDKTCIESLKVETTVPLRCSPETMEYVIDKSLAVGPATTIPELTLIRKFEYDFGGWFTVMMLHFLCTNGRTHLVEIYRFDEETKVGTAVGGLVENVRKLRSKIVKMRRQWQEPVDAAKNKSETEAEPTTATITAKKHL